MRRRRSRAFSVLSTFLNSAFTSLCCFLSRSVAFICAPPGSGRSKTVAHGRRPAARAPAAKHLHPRCRILCGLGRSTAASRRRYEGGRALAPAEDGLALVDE